MWCDLAEIRSLAVAEPYAGNGVGRQIVAQLLTEVRDLGVPTVFALTYQVEFFRRLGFREVAKETLPRKIWADCLDCLKFPDCDETAVVLSIPQDWGEEDNAI
jgi:amino-acid N-acetyltransferase